jgi:hypothetical protein
MGFEFIMKMDFKINVRFKGPEISGGKWCAVARLPSLLWLTISASVLLFFCFEL